MHYEAHFIHNGWELVILSFLMVNNKDIYVITEPTEELLCVELWFSTEGKAFKEIIVSSCKILCVNHWNLITLRWLLYYYGDLSKCCI